MGLIQAPYAPVLEFRRPTESPFGGVTFAVVGTNPTVVSLSAPTSSAADFNLSGLVFTPRGVDRKDGDRFTHNGKEYELFGPARGDQDQPFTGADLGWVSHAIRRSS